LKNKQLVCVILMEFTFEVIQAITNIFVIFGVIIALKQLIMS